MFIKIENNIVVQKQPDEEDGFVQAHPHVVCGQIHDGSNNYNPENFSDPAPVISWDDVRRLQAKLIEAWRWLAERHVTQRENSAMAAADYDNTPEEYQTVLEYFQTVRDQDETTHSTPEDAIAALQALPENPLGE